MMESQIETNSFILGGMPVVKGTRVPIARIKFLVEDEGYSFRAVRNEHPQISKKQLGALFDELGWEGLK